MDQDNSIYYEFGAFHLNPSDRLLLREGRVVPLTPKVFDTLVILVENHGRILTKDELLQAVWPDSIVEESSLSQNIFLLRRTLKEGGDDLSYIETVPRRGYRFTAAVASGLQTEEVVERRTSTTVVIEDEFESGTEPVAAKAVSQSERTSPRPLTRTWLIAPALVLIAGTFWIGLKIRDREHGKPRQVATAFQDFDLARVTDDGKVDRVTLSPDGKYLSYVTEERGEQILWLRQRVGGSALQLMKAGNQRFLGVTFAPDGGSLFYSLQAKDGGPGTLFRIPTLGGTAVKVLDRVGSPITFAPDGKRFGFVRTESAKNETVLVIAGADGSTERELARRTLPAFFGRLGPSWSNDGKLIACATGKLVLGEAEPGVAVVTVLGGAVQEISTPSWSWVGQVSWLPDDSGLVLLSWDRLSPQLIDQLCLLSYPEGQVRRLTSDLNGFGGIGLADDASVLVALRAERRSSLWMIPRDGDDASGNRIGQSFSEPAGGEFLSLTNGNKILYSSSTGGHPNLWVMDSDGTSRRKLTDDTMAEEFPSSSLDGRVIYFASRRGGPPHIWRVDVDTANLTQITHGLGEHESAATADGRWLIYTNVADKSSLWKIEIGGGTAIRLTDQSAYFPTVSPDGKIVACYLRPSDNAAPQLTLLSMADGKILRVFESTQRGSLRPLKWTPDGRFVCYVETVSGVSNVLGQALSGGPAKALTRFSADEIFRFAWSTDGTRLLCERGFSQRDLVVLRDGSAGVARK